MESNRVLWIDFCKGLGIMLMVLYHVIIGLHNFDGQPLYPLFYQVAILIDSFNMERFFFLSGIFVSLSYRKGAKNFVFNKIHRIAYPYFLWTLLQAGINMLMANFTNGTVSALGLLQILYKPLYQFWFLYVLFFMYMAFLVYRKLPVYASLAVGLGLHLISYSIHLDSFPIASIFKMLVFFMVGDYLAAHFRSHLNFLTKKVVLLTLLGFIVLELALFLHTNWLPEPILRLLAASFGALAAIALSHKLSSRNMWGGISKFGKYSMPIFLAHVFFTSATRIALSRSGVSALEWHILLGVVAGLIMPILLVKVLERVNLAEMFALSVAGQKKEQKQVTPQASYV